ncbi:MAG: DsbA family protein [Candidatus Undinarchaeales archaeon]|jgi:protein-disulfide isomerase|nr:DsbA family protein [Candidatus Undinarchaeales archaeon]MDP7494316.1 DsbA family protein [Candidatus Undinarchaeales archaeon]
MPTKKLTKKEIAEIEEELVAVEERLDDMNEVITQRESATDPWMITSLLLAFILVIGVMGFRGEGFAFQPGTSGGGITLQQVQNLAIDMRARGLSETEVAEGLGILGIDVSTIASIVEAPKATPPTATVTPTARPEPTKVAPTPAPEVDEGTAVVTIIEFSDFECPFCGRAHPTIEQIKKEYGSKLKHIFKHFPLSFHPFAQKAAEAAECARDQGKFWEMYNTLFDNSKALGESDIKGYAAELGFDMDEFNECYDSGIKDKIVLEDFTEGQSRGVSGTPAFFIQGTTEDGSIIEESIQGAQPIEVFRDTIDMMIGGQRPTDEDPAMEIVVVNDKECDSCDPTQILTILKTQLFPKATSRIIDISSDEGAALVKDLKLKVVPSYLFPKDVLTASHNYIKLQDMLEDKGEWLTIVPGATGAGRYLEPPSVDDDPSKGPADAPVTIIEFTDFQCPFCKRGTDIVYQIIDTYGDQVRVVIRDFPLAALHPDAPLAHEAAECADEQGKFWEIHDKIFANQADVSIATLKGYANDLGLDMDRFNACLDGGAMKAEIDADMAAGREYGVSGTPAFFINGLMLAGAQPFENFASIIDAQLEKAGAAPAAPAEPTATPAPAEPSEGEATPAPEATPEPTPVPTGRAADLAAAAYVGNTAADSALAEACKSWMYSDWETLPETEHPLGVLATRIVMPGDTRVLTEDEYLAEKDLTKCDCMVFLKNRGGISDSEVRAPFAAETDCSAWGHARGCELLCYGDGEDECKAAHGCA